MTVLNKSFYNKYPLCDDYAITISMKDIKSLGRMGCNIDYDSNVRHLRKKNNEKTDIKYIRADYQTKNESCITFSRSDHPTPTVVDCFGFAAYTLYILKKFKIKNYHITGRRFVDMRRGVGTIFGKDCFELDYCQHIIEQLIQSLPSSVPHKVFNTCILDDLLKFMFKNNITDGYLLYTSEIDEVQEEVLEKLPKRGKVRNVSQYHDAILLYAKTKEDLVMFKLKYSIPLDHIINLRAS